MDLLNNSLDHLAIMRKSWGLTPKILSGEKKIESRWYVNKYQPWDRIKAGEKVYFKDSGDPVTVVAEVDKVLQFADLTPERVSEILDQYGHDDGLTKDKIPEFFEMFRNKKYCMLIYLKDPKKIEPFEINKKGFGMMAAWKSVDDINKIKNNVNKDARS